MGSYLSWAIFRSTTSLIPLLYDPCSTLQAHQMITKWIKLYSTHFGYFSSEFAFHIDHLCIVVSCIPHVISTMDISPLTYLLHLSTIKCRGFCMSHFPTKLLAFYMVYHRFHLEANYVACSMTINKKVLELAMYRFEIFVGQIWNVKVWKIIVGIGTYVMPTYIKNYNCLSFIPKYISIYPPSLHFYKDKDVLLFSFIFQPVIEMKNCLKHARLSSVCDKVSLLFNFFR